MAGGAGRDLAALNLNAVVAVNVNASLTVDAIVLRERPLVA
jgi:hypothetical protein